MSGENIFKYSNANEKVHQFRSVFVVILLLPTIFGWNVKQKNDNNFGECFFLFFFTIKIGWWVDVRCQMAKVSMRSNGEHQSVNATQKKCAVSWMLIANLADNGNRFYFGIIDFICRMSVSIKVKYFHCQNGAAFMMHSGMVLGTMYTERRSPTRKLSGKK